MENTNNDPFLLVQQNRPDELKQLLDENRQLAAVVNSSGVSLLLWAVNHRNQLAIMLIRSYLENLTIWEAACLGETPEVKAQLKTEPELLNAFSADGFTLLGYACFFGQVSTARFLVAQGANVNLPSANSFKVAPLHSACAISNSELASLLIANGADVNAKQQGGFTPLHSAVQNKSTELIHLLLNAGADPAAQNDNGVSAVMLAQESGVKLA